MFKIEVIIQFSKNIENIKNVCIHFINLVTFGNYYNSQFFKLKPNYSKFFN